MDVCSCVLCVTCLSALSSVCMEQLGSKWIDYDEIWYLSNFQKSIENIEDSLKSDKNNEYFTRRLLYICITSRSVLLRVRNAADRSCRQHQNARFMFNNSFSKIV